jgi:hypothetical protein
MAETIISETTPIPPRAVPNPEVTNTKPAFDRALISQALSPDSLNRPVTNHDPHSSRAGIEVAIGAMAELCYLVNRGVGPRNEALAELRDARVAKRGIGKDGRCCELHPVAGP